MPFIRAGFDRGDKTVHILDSKYREEHLRRLENALIDTRAAEARGQLELRSWEETYLRSGRFDGNEMVRLLEEILTKARSDGFHFTRAVGQMDWILNDWPAFDDLLAYEMRLNDVLPKYHDAVICVYTRRRFDAKVVMDVLRCHPAVMISGVVHKNPFFVSSKDMPNDIHEQKGRQIDLVTQGAGLEEARVRRAISDLVALSVLPAEWVGREPGQIADGILSILTHCARIGAAHLRIRHRDGHETQSTYGEGWPEFQDWLKSMDSRPPGSEAISQEQRIEISRGGKTFYILQIPIGIEAEAGWIAVGSSYPDFPDQMERLALSVAGNQGLISLQNSSLLHERERVVTELEVLKEDADRTGTDELIGSSAAIRGVISKVSKVAPTDSTVLITGETGTGKELVARAIHKRSRRKERPFITVNCAALPASLIASELFGHESGAFTGAQQRRLGRFELATEGTLFLDEVGELPQEMQVALLRVLQERAFERLGGTEQVRVNVRVMAATNRDLRAAVAAGTFRSDLYYRLNVFPIEVPPLRDRKEDLAMLTRHFIDRYSVSFGKKIRSIDPATLQLFQTYDWPGNIRELQNVVERSLILSEGDTFSVDAAWFVIDGSRTHTGSLLERIIAYERELVENALSQSKGKVAGPAGAARKLGIASTTLESRIKALNINKNQFRL